MNYLWENGADVTRSLRPCRSSGFLQIQLHVASIWTVCFLWATNTFAMSANRLCDGSVVDEKGEHHWPHRSELVERRLVRTPCPH